MEQIVRVYRPQVPWILLLAAQLQDGDPMRERAFNAILRGSGADPLPLSEVRRRRL